MATSVRSVDFLPEIFRTNTNKQFLSSTLDQLVQEPKVTQRQGYIGRKVGVGVDPNDSYLVEPSAERSDYQLEPGVVFLKPNQNVVDDVITYPGMIDTLALKGANVTRADRLFNSEYYSWDSFVDFDKFVNFGQYYWLPEGPDSVDVSATAIPLTDDFTVTRGTNGYTLSGYSAVLPTITLVRGGNYTFDVSQTGNPFWIQAAPGKSGTLPFSSQSSREVLGVSNNGDDLGTITFNVPDVDAQNFYFTLADGGSVDLVTDLKFNQIYGSTLSNLKSTYGGIDGFTDIGSRTLIFTETADGEAGGWTDDGGATYITDDATKYGIWRINLSAAEDPIITLSLVQSVSNLTKFNINYGTANASSTWYKDANGYYVRQPLITANADTLYYQDGTNDNFFGVINFIEESDDAFVNVTEILQSSTYTSPNGVTFTNGLKVQFEGLTQPASYSGKEYYIEGVGTQIKLLPVTDFKTPETYTTSSTVPFDSTGFDAVAFDDSLNAPTVQDYLTINRASLDLNAWTRSNRWFHVDIINVTAQYNNSVAVLDNDNRAKRPILEFKPSYKLYNSGVEGIQPVNVIDTTEQDAFSNVNGSLGYSTDGYSLTEGSRIIFAADLDTAVRNKVYVVSFVRPNPSSDPVIDLQPADISSPGVSTNHMVVQLNGVKGQGKSYFYNGTGWIEAQQKTAVNQAPLFDLFDNLENSFSDTDVYPSSTFAGSKLFSYAVGTGVADSVLGTPLKYQSINNVGDITFTNNLYSDTFLYVDDSVSVTENISLGHVQQYSSLTAYTKQLGWQTATNQITSRQIFSFTYNAIPLVLDIKVDTIGTAVPVKVFVDGEFVLPSTYTVTTNSSGLSVITFITAPATGTPIEVSVTSNTPSQIAYYSIPANLENNAINIDTKEFTLGTIRNHYNTICQNLQDFTGKINGANNIRDLGNITPYGESIQQQSSPLTFAGTFLKDKDFDYYNAIDWSSYEYEKYKNVVLDTVARIDWSGKTNAYILDTCLQTINSGKNQFSPFYWSDTLPTGNTYAETKYTYTAISTNVFDILYSYDLTKANYQGILVYRNDTILTGFGHDYTVATDGPRITINTDNVTLAVNDVITIREYTTTYGNYVPPSAACLGLSPLYQPEKFTDNTYVTPTDVIRGHDGSLTVAFGDIRDDILLEFETRIYNNTKVANRYNEAIEYTDVVPGQFRTTEYTMAEVNEMLSQSFLSWVGTNKLDYKTQVYDANNAFTWNYSNSQNKLDGTILLGGWRGIYFDLYDTDSPHTRPWEMLGITEEPTWWQNAYGPAPYTSGNLVLWEDLRDGKIAYPTGSVVVEKYKRPQLLDIIPTDSEGNLLAPMYVIVGNYDQNSFQKSWNFGDQGPTETAWRRSSQYRFALQKLLALTKPAQYFSLFADLDLYKENTNYNQFLYNNRYRLNSNDVVIYGNGTAKNSYINYIVDYNRIKGLDSTTALTTTLQNIDIRLCYRVAGFTDQKYFRIYSEKSSPNSLNASLLWPDESLQLVLYKNPASSEINWSSVIIQSTATGYAVYGYSTTKPYFEIYRSLTNGNYNSIQVAGQTVRVAKDFSDTVVRVPYGYSFTSISSVVDFLISYGQRLSDLGMNFDSQYNNIVLNWTQMAEEFVYWSQQGWSAGAIINLNPSAGKLEMTGNNTVVDSLVEPGRETALLDANRQPIQSKDYVIERLDNTFTLLSQNNTSFNYLNAQFVSYEHILIFDNTSIFNDLLYSPGTGARQTRLLFDGNITSDWNGTLNAQGFILNQDNIQEWLPNRAYSKGEIVLYKDSYWSAGAILPPAEKFNFNDWIKSDYERISKGLLPNLAQKSELVENYYDTKTANTEQDADLLAFGLIGFRPRDYMEALNLDDISQVNLFQQFIGTKGTTQATDVFSNARLDKEVAEYDIFENWAIQRAYYGANANRSYYELKLDESLLLSNPSTVSVIQPQETNTADQQVLLSDIYKQSYKLTSTDILPAEVYGNDDTSLPSAGYVNADDVDLQVFDLNDLTSLIGQIDNIALGTVVWVAKSNPFDWNIYRANIVDPPLVQVRDNLDGTSTLTFNGNHGLIEGDRVVIKYFDADVDGAYEVATVPGLKTITLELSLPGDETVSTGNGTVFVLRSVRVAQASDIANLGIVNSLTAKSQIWVDNDGTDHWAVYQKNNPFSSNNSIKASAEDANDLFGTSVGQGFNNQGALIGAPGYNSEAGGVYTYNKADRETFLEKSVLAPNGTYNFGDVLDIGSKEWAVIGAHQSVSARGYAYTVLRNVDIGTFDLQQVLLESTTSTNSEFSKAVTISSDERWMYVGSPGDDKVYCYNKVDVQKQSMEFTGNGTNNSFVISGTIIVDDDSSDFGIGSQQINVSVNNVPQTANVDYTYTAGTVVMTTIPTAGSTILITRKQSVTYNPTVSQTGFLIEDLYTASDIYSFTVNDDGEILRPYIDYTFDASTKTVTTTSGVTGSIVFSSNTYWKLVGTITYAGVDSTGIGFGEELTTTTDGRQIMIGVPTVSAGDEIPNAGQVMVYDRSVERVQVTNATTKVYTTIRTPVGPCTVKLNKQFLVRDTGTNNNGQYTVVGNTITFDASVTLQVGDVLEFETNTFNLMQTIESNSVQRDAQFGYSIDQCSTNCSLYIGAPFWNSALQTEVGNVERWINQNRLYGLITSKNANATLSPGTSIRINDVDVLVTTPTTWLVGSSYTTGAFVKDGATIYKAKQAVPSGTAISDTDYWAVSNWVEYYANDINTADIPNVTASYANGLLSLHLVNADAGNEFIKLVVLPGLGGAWTALGFTPMVYAQTITAPIQQEQGHFGQSVTISDTATSLIVGAPDSTANLPTTFDNNTTLFNGGAMEFIDPINRSGVVYTYDFLASANASATNPGKFVFGQQIYDRTLGKFDNFGATTSYADTVLLIGVPNSDLGDSVGDFGRVAQFNNVNLTPSWSIKYRQQPQVDVSLLNSVFTYNRTSSAVTQYLDYIDPIQGKILGAAKQNIDYIVGLDPASYNVGNYNNIGQFWGDERVGEVWWDVSTMRYIDYHQATIEYKARRWGQLFEGSSIDVYQWIKSDVPPSSYTGPGTVYNSSRYVVASELDQNGVFSSVFYFWVKNLTSIDQQKKKTLSILAVAQYIENPRSSGVQYIAPVAQNTVALYNCRDLLSATDTVLHVEFDREKNDDNVHVEYDLIAKNNPLSFLSDGTYRKFLDSFCGEDTLGNKVPDSTLSIADQYGINFRPRQSMVVDRFLALENYFDRANKILALYPIVEQKLFTLLNSEEPEPTSASGQWDKRVLNYAELTYQNFEIVSAGYRYLVASDETQNGLWTIYTLQADKTLFLSRVQTYDTKQYWQYTDWVQPGYNLSTEIVAEVPTFNDIALLTNVTNGQSVKVTANSFGKSELYQLVNGTYNRVFAEDTTIKINSTIWDYSLGRFGFDIEVFDAQRFDRFPSTETRQILKALNEEIFTDNLLIHRNELLVLMFEYILAEQNAPNWLFKTSLVDIQHKIRDLIPYPVYKRDNQDFVLNYINEVKPYHVKIKEFSLRYDGLDTYLGNTTDFDCPAYYDSVAKAFISPILKDNGTGLLNNGQPNVSETPSTDPIWTTWPWSQWYNNYTLSLASVTLVNGGSGYTVEPQVTVTGTATTLPTLRAKISTAGAVTEIEVISAGSGYVTTPQITISGGNGSGAIAVPLMQNNMVRSFDTTLKFDRYEYVSSVQDWAPNTDYVEGSLVRYQDNVYKVNEVADSTELDSGATFDPDFYTLVDESTLSGADRVIGLYQPDSSDPGRELALVLTGIDYPGVQVAAPGFNKNTGYDVGNFDTNPFDNLDFGPEGFPTYSDDILNAIYSSSFTDTYLGTRSTDINVDGSEFIDTYSSHAPEELVPGSNFDTLDLTVSTRPGADWTSDGHGFNVQSEDFVATSTTLTVDWSSQMLHPVGVSVENLSTGVNLNALQHFTVNWPAKTVSVTDGISADDIVRVRTFGVGGGNQLLRQTLNGSLVGNSLTIDVDYDEIYEILAIVNGVQTTAFTYAAGSYSWQTLISFTSTYTSTDLVTIVVLGTDTPQRSWSTPRGEYFIYDGSTLSFTLSESLQGTNPIDLFVFQDGKRLRPAETAQYTGDGSSAGPYYLPTRGQISQGFVSDNDVKVYVDNEEQFLSVDWTLTPWDGSSDRYVAFNVPPDSGANIKIAVTTAAAYFVSGNTLTLRTSPATDAVINVVTFNDTSEQKLLTQVFQGPTETGTVVTVDFDSVAFDSGDFDATTGIVLQNNDLATGVAITNDSRIEVHKNGFRLTPGEGFETNTAGIVTIGGGTLGPGDIVTITSYTMAVTPEEMSFRIFQDMLENQKIYRINQNNTTTLARALEADDDIIYLTNATKVSPTDIPENILGVVMVGEERITYRTRNLANNTVSGLRRGVAGTAIQSHSVGETVTDSGFGEQLPLTYQQQTTQSKFTGDGTTKVFLASNISLEESLDSTEIEEVVRVNVGGAELAQSAYTVTQLNPAEVTLIDAPAKGVEIIVSIIRGKVMYAQGASTASNGIALQEQTTTAARFIRGQI